MSELGGSLRAAREAAGLSLSGMARRTGYSRSYIGNVETGTKQPTPAVIRAYERALGDDQMDRRKLLVVAAASAVGGTMAPMVPMSDGDMATGITADIMAERPGLLTSVLTSHTTDKAIGGMISKQASCLASLHKWMRKGSATLRANSAGILAKSGSREAAEEVAKHLWADAEARQLYLACVVARVLRMPWDDARELAQTAAFDEAQVARVAAEVQNDYDVGARWCSVYLLGKARDEHTGVVDVALHQALSTEPSREMLRHIGYALAAKPAR